MSDGVDDLESHGPKAILMKHILTGDDIYIPRRYADEHELKYNKGHGIHM